MDYILNAKKNSVRDPGNEGKIRLLHPKVRAGFKSFIEEAEDELNISLCVVQGWRSFIQQQALYEQGRTKPGPIVTWSPAGTSYHNYGLAIDVCPYLSNKAGLNWSYDFEKLKPIAANYQITWGGDFPDGKKDVDHFENKLSHNWRELLHLYNAKKFLPGTTFVAI